MPATEPAPPSRSRLAAGYALLGLALAAGAVAAAAGLWLVLSGVAAGTVRHRDLSRAAGAAAIVSGLFVIGWGIFTSRLGMWPSLPRWVRPAVGTLLVVVIAVSFLI